MRDRRTSHFNSIVLNKMCHDFEYVSIKLKKQSYPTLQNTSKYILGENDIKKGHNSQTISRIDHPMALILYIYSKSK